MQIVEGEIKKTAAITSKGWTPKLTPLDVMNAELTHANELRGALLDSMAHDLRSPLTAIRAFSEILRTQSAMTKREQEEMFAIVEKECCRLDKMIEKTINNPQLVLGTVQINPQPQKLRKLLNL
jgi:two-component system sensor histidine kinase KdpD